MAIHSIPDMAKQFHQLFTRGAEYFSNNKEGEFTISIPSENSLHIAMLESGWMMGSITLRDIDSSTGQAIEIGDNSLHSGRVLSGRFKKKLNLNGTPFELVETDSCVSLSYEQLGQLANINGFDKFVSLLSDFFGRAVSLDMLRVGFNGEYAGLPTNPIENPKGEDINTGWHAIAREFNNGSQVITEKFSLGEGGDYPHLDALANQLIKDKIPEAFREDPRLVVLVGAELAAKERLRLFNAADRSLSDTAAAQLLTSSIAGRFAFVPPFMPGKRLAVTTLENLHIYTQKGSRRFRAEFVDDSAEYQHAYLRNEGYALGNGFLYAAADETAITLL
ncbi:P2 family phage major capsid protein [Rahnella aceris]|uniref:P2 family phage major capsid protein n=1 Tax=Rahnella sp. (strain Y9602) TaxID=2703885 RepID=UPI001C27CE25|nr:P2 family phage major capsid protein [Rahnella aceris]MBU9862099.1 P2 family phage major capsid protein [Rahnella aceris]